MKLILQKHHYRELCKEAQDMLGHSVESFIDYWSQHFPCLLYHTWVSMQALRFEPGFRPYYDPNYLFPEEKQSYKIPQWIIELSTQAEKPNQLSPSKKMRRSPTKNSTTDTQVRNINFPILFFNHSSYQGIIQFQIIFV